MNDFYDPFGKSVGGGYDTDQRQFRRPRRYTISISYQWLIMALCLMLFIGIMAS